MKRLACEAAADEWRTFATFDDFAGEQTLMRRVGEVEILLVRTSDGVVAVLNRCTHRGKPLDRGRVLGGQITCPYHGACFDLKSGRPVAGPAEFPLKVFPTQVVGNEIRVCVGP